MCLGCGREISKHDGEFVSADACDRIHFGEHSHEAFCRDHQHLVADRMPEAVIDVLKPANIEEKDVKAHAGIVFVFFDQLTQHVAELFAVGKVRQRIVHGSVLKITLTLAKCNVGLFFLVQGKR